MTKEKWFQYVKLFNAAFRAEKEARREIMRVCKALREEFSLGSKEKNADGDKAFLDGCKVHLRRDDDDAHRCLSYAIASKIFASEEAIDAAGGYRALETFRFRTRDEQERIFTTAKEHKIKIRAAEAKCFPRAAVNEKSNTLTSAAAADAKAFAEFIFRTVPAIPLDLRDKILAYVRQAA